jgi:hypothetical protein
MDLPTWLPLAATATRWLLAHRRRSNVHAVHRTIVVLDVEAFGDRQRTNLDQVVVRSGMYRAVRRAIRAAGIPSVCCEFEDRGDGVLILVSADVPKCLFVRLFPDALNRELRAHNSAHPHEQRIRLRMAIHAGEVNYDAHGVTANAVTMTFRLVDAALFKAELTHTSAVLAVITSQWFFDEVVRHSPARPACRPLHVAVKETLTTGWVSVAE